MMWWFCADANNAAKYVWVRTERWFDARRTAWELLAVDKVWISQPKLEYVTPPKRAYKDKLVFEAKWEGSAAGLNDLHLEVKRIRVRRMHCDGCQGLFWPWEVHSLSGKMVHLESDTKDDEESVTCGPVAKITRTPSVRRRESLPDILPYEAL